MRTVIYKDKKIKEKEYRQVLDDYTAFLEKHAKVEPVFWTVEYDFTDYPTVVDGDGDDIIRPDFLQDIADEITFKYGDFGTDHVVTLIHEDNWKSGATSTRKGISGTNYSYRFGKYHVQYCRWWRRKGKSVKQELINTLGTLNHEQDHAYDALIQAEIGINVNPILGVSNYDRDTTHGGKNPPYQYINYKQNAAKLEILAPYLRAAYAKRLERHTEVVKGYQMTIIGLLERIVYQLLLRKNIKNGNPKK